MNIYLPRSGGGSAMMMKPINGVSFEQKRKRLMSYSLRHSRTRSKRIRKALSQVKGDSCFNIYGHQVLTIFF